MTTRAIYFQDVNQIAYENNQLIISGKGVEINHSNKKEIFEITGRNPYNVLLLIPSLEYLKITETLDHFFINDGSFSRPRMFSIVTDNSYFVFSEVCFSHDSIITYDNLLQFMHKIKFQFGVRADTYDLNFLMYGNQ